MNRSVTFLLSIAFAFVLALLIGVGIYGMSSLRVIDTHLGLITDQLLKKYSLTMTMRRAARERSFNLHRMILMTDPFDRDDEWSHFNKNGSDFIVARQELVEMGLTARELEILERPREIIGKNVLVQRAVVELAMSGNLTAATELLIEEALPVQNDIFEYIEELLNYYKQALHTEKVAAAAAYHRIVTVGWIVGGIALLAGLLVAVWSVRRIGLGQRDLFAHEQELREILNGMMTGVMTIDENGLIESFNHAAISMFGYDSDEIVGESINKLMPKSYRAHHDIYLKKYFSSTNVDALMGEREIYSMRADGTMFPMRIMLSKLPPNSDGRGRVVASCVDITEQKEQEERLRSSQKMDALGKLTGGIAHDYNNMLGIIMGYSELMAKKCAGDPKMQPYINKIHQAAERGSQLTKKLLSFTRRKPIEESVVDINALLTDDKMMLERTLMASVQLEIELADELCEAFLDVDDLENAILNLCINAKHAMPDGGQLSIKTHQITLDVAQATQKKLTAGEYVLLQIEDSGCGMDEETRRRIFEPFFSTKGDSGTGLGLSQVYGFVNRSKGDISVTSSPGVGTRFELLFPCCIVTEDRQLEEKGGTDLNELGGSETILVVDDESALCEMAEEILSNNGYRVFTASSGEQALSILESEQVDLLVSDIIMPEMNGYKLAEIVAQEFPKVKIQLMSGYYDHVDAVATDKTLQANILQKPFNSDELLTKIRALLEIV